MHMIGAIDIMNWLYGDVRLNCVFSKCEKGRMIIRPYIPELLILKETHAIKIDAHRLYI